jgi:thiamine-triphosphatase
MIEVEKKFKLDEAQLARIKKLATFVSKKAFTDIYFDDKKYSLTSRDMWLRKRGNDFELKIPGISARAGKRVNVYVEIYGPKKISQKLKLKKNYSGFIFNLQKNGYRQFCKIRTTRKKYSYGAFIIDIDEIDFGYSLCEIERVAKNKQEISRIGKEIISFGKKLGLKIDWGLRGKVLEYLWRYDKKHYNKLKKSKVIL